MKYNNAPIREAVFDIYINELSHASLEKINELHKLICEDYPISKKRINYTSKISVSDQEASVSNEGNSQLTGYFFVNKDKTKVVQYRVDGFSFNLLEPYDDWNAFSKEALKMWEIFSKHLSPVQIKRIGLRYINKINIPISMGVFQEYIVNIPPIPKCLPQTFNNFFMQIEVPCEDNTHVVVTETIEPHTNECIPFIVNIDAQKDGHIANEVKILETEFQKLRELKNNTFENCITDKTRDLFK